MKSAVAPPRRNKEERDRLVEQFLPLVRHVVARMAIRWPASTSADDFYSAGVMGLMHAATTYDPARGASFKTFAYTAIRGAILDEVRRIDPVPRSRRDRLRRLDRTADELRAELGRQPSLAELAERLGIDQGELDEDLLALHTSRLLSLDEAAQGDDAGVGAVLCDPRAFCPGDRAERNEQIERLGKAIGELPEVDRNVVVLYHYENLYLKEIGEILGVTESRVSQILSRALARLQLKLDRSGSE